MCTASWLTQDARLHLFFNRDELTTREPALPPEERSHRGVRYVAPTDPRGGGTWIAATQRGAAFALLNKSGGTVPSAPLSRGGLIPEVSAAPDADALEATLRALALARYAPFRLLALWRAPAAGVALGWDGANLDVQPLDPALGLLASSGLGDEPAFERRGELWRRRRAEAASWGPDDHRAFHREHAPRRGAWSVCVHRRDAASVSFTEVELGAERVALRYFEGSPCTATRAVERRLATAPAGGS